MDSTITGQDSQITADSNGKTLFLISYQYRAQICPDTGFCPMCIPKVTNTYELKVPFPGHSQLDILQNP